MPYSLKKFSQKNIYTNFKLNDISNIRKINTHIYIFGIYQN